MNFIAISRKALFIAVLCGAVSNPATAQRSTGAIGGTVSDEGMAIVQGVRVVLSNPSIIGGSKMVLTDERGGYRFIALVPATYSIRVESPGFKAYTRETIDVNADVTARVDVRLEVGSVSETVTVVGQAPNAEMLPAPNQFVLDRRFLDGVPTGNDLWSIGRLVPGILLNKYDVGGSESFQQSNLSVHGSPVSEKKFVFDGLEVNWPGGDGGATGLYYDLGSMAEVNYQVGSIAAENRQGGVIINMVTKTGTNDLHGSFDFIGTRDSFQGDNLSDVQRADLLASIPAFVKSVNPALVPRTRIMGLFDSGVSLTGPILRDRLWFSTSYKLSSLNQLVVGTYNADGTQAIDDNRILNAMGKVSWRVNDSSQLHFTYNRNHKNRYHRRSEAFTENRAANLQDQKGYSTQLKFTTPVNDHFLVDITAGYHVIDNPARPQKEVVPGTMSRFDVATNVLTDAARTYTLNPSYRGALGFAADYYSGGHAVKAGFQWDRAMSRNITAVTNEMQARFSAGNPISVRLSNAPTDSRIYIKDWAIYAQDNWKALPRLTVSMGLRMESTTGEVPEQVMKGNQFIEGKVYPPLKDVPRWFNMAPRFSLAFDAFGSGRTVFKLSASRYHLTLGAELTRFVSSTADATEDRPWSDTNSDRVPQINELGPGPGFNLGVFNSFNPELKRPYSNEYSVGLQHQLPGQTVISAAFYHRSVRNNIGVKNRAVPIAAYVPFPVVEPTTGMPVTVYNVPSQLNAARDYYFDNFRELDSHFNGADITVVKRMNHRFQLLGSLSYGRNYGDILGSIPFVQLIDLNDPNVNQNRRGAVGDDVPWSARLSSTVQLPYRIYLSTNVQHFTGRPERQIFRVTRLIVPALTRAQQDIDVAVRGASRLPNVNLWDLRITRKFQVGDRLSINPLLDIFNLTNSGPVLDRIAQLGPSYHRVTNVLPPRMLRLGLHLDF